MRGLYELLRDGITGDIGDLLIAVSIVVSIGSFVYIIIWSANHP